MEIELIQDGKAVDYNKYQEVIENVKESLFRRNMDKETKEWMYISNFVGILLDKDRLILTGTFSTGAKINNRDMLSLSQTALHMYRQQLHEPGVLRKQKYLLPSQTY